MRSILFALFACLAVAPAAASDASLVVAGAIEADRPLTFGQDDLLDAMPAVVIRTRTPWTDGVQELRGVRWNDLMAHVGARGREVRAQAINDYTVVLPVRDAMMDLAVLAVEANGEKLHRRGKGPFWVVFPYDHHPELETDVSHQRSIWQLVRLTVR